MGHSVQGDTQSLHLVSSTGRPIMGYSVQGDTRDLHVVLGSQPQAVPSWGIQSKGIPSISMLSQGLSHRPSHHGVFSPRRYPVSPCCLRVSATGRTIMGHSVQGDTQYHHVASGCQPQAVPSWGIQSKEIPSITMLPQGVSHRPSHHGAFSPRRYPVSPCCLRVSATGRPIMGHLVQGDTQYLHVASGSQPQAVPSWGIQSKEIPSISMLSQGLIHRPYPHGAFSPRRHPVSPCCLRVSATGRPIMGHSVQGDTQYLHVVLGSHPQAVPSWGIQSKETPSISMLS